MFDSRLLISSINERVQNSIVKIDLRIQMALRVTAAAEERIAMDSLCSREMDGIELRCSRIHSHYDRSHSIEVVCCVDCEAIVSFHILSDYFLCSNTFVCYYSALMN